MFKKLSDTIGRVFSSLISRPPQAKDSLILSIFVILITFQPFYTQGRINLFELGLYLPGIQAILEGQVPFRDFFHLRGPFELYMPALAMKFFGVHLSVLYTYFYVGNVLCLVFCVWILKELLSTRLMLYLAVPVIVARTFPRVVFMIWGGMRYAWGLLAVWCVIKFFMTQRCRWMFWAGLTTALGLLTSVEIGIYVILGLLIALTAALLFKTLEKQLIVRALGCCVLGGLIVVVPYFIYLASHQALGAYFESTFVVVTKMQKIIDPHLVSVYPRDFKEAAIAMLSFGHTNFKHMTPSYLYLGLLGYILWSVKQKRLNMTHLCLLFLGVYGFIMYNTGFRGLWAAQFEMALMPEKILYFFIVETVFLIIWVTRQKAVWRRNVAYFCVAGLLISSLAYSIQRFNHRFFAFKAFFATLSGKGTAHLEPLAKEPKATLTFERAKGMVVPADQAEELEAIVGFLSGYSAKGDTVFTYPELGIYNFFADRPFLGRFPIVTFTWMNQPWHRELMEQLKSKPVKYLVLQKVMAPGWETLYLAPPLNRQKYDEVMDLIASGFIRVGETPASFIYERK